MSKDFVTYAARIYFADKATDKAAIPEECAMPSLLLSIQSVVEDPGRAAELTN